MARATLEPEPCDHFPYRYGYLGMGCAPKDLRPGKDLCGFCRLPVRELLREHGSPRIGLSSEQAREFFSAFPGCSHLRHSDWEQPKRIAAAFRKNPWSVVKAWNDFERIVLWSQWAALDRDRGERPSLDVLPKEADLRKLSSVGGDLRRLVGRLRGKELHSNVLQSVMKPALEAKGERGGSRAADQLDAWLAEADHLVSLIDAHVRWLRPLVPKGRRADVLRNQLSLNVVTMLWRCGFGTKGRTAAELVRLGHAAAFGVNLSLDAARSHARAASKLLLTELPDIDG